MVTSWRILFLLDYNLVAFFVVLIAKENVKPIVKGGKTVVPSRAAPGKSPGTFLPFFAYSFLTVEILTGWSDISDAFFFQ